jgi:hypothetical protein
VLAAGDLIYLDAAAAGVAKKADNSTQAKAAVVGMCVNSTTKIGQPVSYIRSGEVIITAASFAGVGRHMMLSSTAGKMEPEGDMSAGDWITQIGYSSSTAKVVLNIVQSGLQYTA